MKIACLGWGSLIWEAGELRLRTEWYEDGPSAKVEFVRQSNDDRITLVLTEVGAVVRIFWALMDYSNIEDAKEALRQREGWPVPIHIGSWTKDANAKVPDDIPQLAAWAAAHDLDAVVWTALPPKFKGKNNVIPSIDEVLEHLRQLEGPKFVEAAKYIRRAPQQIDTPYRRRIVAELGDPFVTPSSQG